MLLPTPPAAAAPEPLCPEYTGACSQNLLNNTDLLGGDLPLPNGVVKGASVAECCVACARVAAGPAGCRAFSFDPVMQMVRGRPEGAGRSGRAAGTLMLRCRGPWDRVCHSASLMF